MMRRYVIRERLNIRKKHCMGMHGNMKKWLPATAAALFFAVLYWQCSRVQIKNVFRHLKAEFEIYQRGTLQRVMLAKFGRNYPQSREWRLQE